MLKKCSFITLVLIITFSVLNASPKWTQPIIEDNPNITGHIFKKSPGHFDKNIPENRSFIECATSSSSFKVGENRHGVEIYLKTASSGEQAWAYVRNGKIIDGGRNNFPKQWVVDDSKNGGKFITPKFTQYRADSQTFKGHLVVNNIKNVYEAACQTPQYTALQIRKIQGVAGRCGKILNLLDYPEQEESHTFYIPTYELSETEALQVLRDIARGVYVYGDLSFFSLHFNRSMTSYPVIPPVYRHTLTREALAMLDYFMKGFVKETLRNF